MKVNYSLLESKYKELRPQLIENIAKIYDLSEDIARGIVDYENTEINEDCEVEYNQVKALIEEDMFKGRQIHILSMIDKIMKNDEGKYQLSLK